MNKYLVLGFMYLMLIFGLYFYQSIQPQEFLSPCPESGCDVVVTPSPTPEPTKSPEVEVISANLTGLASYYSIDGCIGCNENRTMANGERLDDSKLTVAFNRAPLNSFIKITNVKTGAQVTAKVTDRGGFERHGKIVDLSVATKNALGCGDVCQVEIQI